MEYNSFFIEKCKMRTTKKDKYYVHTYEPKKLINKFKENSANNIYQQYYLINLIKIMDMNSYYNCCNCILLILYNNQLCDETCIKSINQTILCVKKYLPEWIVRIYMDDDTYFKLQKYSNDPINEKFHESCQNILDAENTEIYTFNHGDKFDHNINNRIYRFLSLVDDKVNICIYRNAKEAITLSDCINILKFQENNEIIYQNIDRLANLKSNNFATFNYSNWHQMYKYIEDSFFKKYLNHIELESDYFGTSMKINKRFFLKKINESKEYIYKFIGDQPDSLTNFFGYVDKNSALVLDRDCMVIGKKQENYSDDQMLILNSIYYDIIINPIVTRFDEIFLLNIFKKLISYEYTIEANKLIVNKDMKNICKKIFWYNDNKLANSQKDRYYHYKLLKYQNKLNKIDDNNMIFIS